MTEKAERITTIPPLFYCAFPSFSASPCSIFSALSVLSALRLLRPPHRPRPLPREKGEPYRATECAVGAPAGPELAGDGRLESQREPIG
jgi:hypothetical protein